MGWDEQTAWARTHSLKPIELDHWCPMYAARGYCKDRKSWVAGKCICTDPAILAVRRRERTWRGRYAGYVLTTEPLSVSEEQFHAVELVVTKHRISVYWARESAWGDGTPMLVFSRPGIGKL